MISRYSFKWQEPKLVSCPVKVEYELVTIIEPLSFNEDKTVKEYREIQKYVKHETLWQDFIDSFDLGSISEQVINHLTKGTPLVTAHTLPPGDYTPEALEKGAKAKQMLDSKGITLDMIVEAVRKANEADKQPVKEEVVASSESEAK